MPQTINASAPWASYCQLVQQLAAGTVRRNVFTEWEMRLLLDVQMTRIRKSARPELLRRYLKAVEQQMSGGAAVPQTFSSFFENDPRARRSSHPVAQRMMLPQAS